MERGLELLRADNKSGYSYVFPTGAKWQAKVYARPGPKGQRGLGSFDSQKQAAEQVLSWVLGLVGTPPTPTKDINARGMGKRPRDKCHGVARPRALSSLPLAHSRARLLAGGPGRYKSKRRDVSKQSQHDTEKGRDKKPVEAPAASPKRPRGQLVMPPRDEPAPGAGSAVAEGGNAGCAVALIVEWDGAPLEVPACLH